MNVVLLNQYYLPAEAPTALLLADLAESLARRGHDVRVVCSRRSYTEPRTLYPARETLGGVQVIRTWSSGLGRSRGLHRLVDSFTFFAGASLALLRQRPDVVVSLTSPPMVGLLALVTGRLRSARVLQWVMDLYPDVAFALGVMREDGAAGRLFSSLSSWLLRRSDRVVALGETMAEHLEHRGASRVAVVHNWVDGTEIRPRPVKGHTLRERWGWSDRFVVLYSGNLGLAHEFGTVVDAAERLRDDPRLLFAFLGGGPRRDALEAEVQRRGLTNFEFRPYVDHSMLASSLTAGDVHLVSLREGMPGLLVPSKIYGILAAGRPCLFVGPAAGELPQILDEGDCGSRLAPGDDAGLARTIRSYMEDDGLRERQGHRARELFERRFDRPHALRSLVGLVEDLERG